MSTIRNNLKNLLCVVSVMSAITAFAEAPKDYYTSCENKGGETLLSALYTQITNHTQVGYNGLWELYKTTDVDENGKIWDMYSTKRWTPGGEQCGNYQAVGDCYNREHSFPESWFGKKENPMYCDAFHIYPTDGYVNNQRGNYPYGECASGTQVKPNGSIKPLGKLGASTFSGYSGTVFEPDDQYKGDFARSYFYMAACYNDKIANWDSDMLAGNKYPAFTDWATELLLKWHRQDPVSPKELARQEAVYAEQNNRNPFIDHPEMVEYIWGDKKTEKWSSGEAAEPSFATPINGSTIDLGNAALNIEKTTTVIVRASNLTADATLSVSGTGFTVSPATMPASSANSADGAAATIKFQASEAGTYTGTLTITSATAKTEVSLKATALSGLVASEPTNVTSDSFVAHWINSGDADSEGNYSLYVLDAEGVIPGFPVSVAAADEKYRVEGLTPQTKYTYSLRSATQKSNVITVTTTAVLPSVEFYFDEALHFVTRPGVPSSEAELLVEIENIDTDVTVSVSAPFQLSTDKEEWSTTCILSPEEDRIYMRLLSDTEGEFATTIKATAGDYVNDRAEATGTVSKDSGIAEFGVGVDYHDWDAYARGGQLIFETSRTVSVAIYGIDGLTYHIGEVKAGASAFDLPAGLYIVSVDDFTRRVLVK